jgi:hypothetical protein
MAQAYDYSLNFQCPDTHGSVNVLTNYGTYIGGDGTELNSFSDILTPAFFKSVTTTDQKYPANISEGGYLHSGTSYTQATGVVSCMYQSTLNYDDIRVNYTITNGTGGFVTTHTDNTITISLSNGLKNKK